MAGQGRADSTDVGEHRNWFERLYAEADAGRAEVPWDRDGPNKLFAQWASEHDLSGDGRRALVVGCGLGSDSEYTGALGFDTVAFDFAPGAIEEVRRRFPDSPVEYQVADLLDPPSQWAGAFDFVLESLTVQSLPRSFRAEAIGKVRSFVVRGGTLLVISGIADEWEDGPDGPWPLTREDIGSFTADGLELVRLETPPGIDGSPRWRAEFHLRLISPDSVD
jgi:SAM-dependent methyltransferase